LKFSNKNKNSFISKHIVKENSEYVGINLFVETNVSKIKKLFDGHVLKWPRYYDI